MVEETNRSRIFLRRYRSNAHGSCPVHGYCNVKVQIDEGITVYTAEGSVESLKQPPHDDTSWPTHCQCGYAFQETDEWQCFQDPIYANVPDKTPPEAVRGEWTMHELPPGAMMHPRWLQPTHPYGAAGAGGGRIHWKPGPDGKVLWVKTPGGEWIIDSRCSNCTLPDDNEHFCWVRHGEAPYITVDKNGHTCSAGGGSIQAGNYHGFLIDGWLRAC